MEINISEKVLSSLIADARSEVYSDDEEFIPSDHSGGNFDDCFQLGVEEGYTIGVRDVLNRLGIDWKNS